MTEEELPMERDFIWVLAAIDSSQTELHFEGSENLIALFSKKYGKEGEKYTNHLLGVLAKKLIVKPHPYADTTIGNES